MNPLIKIRKLFPAYKIYIIFSTLVEEGKQCMKSLGLMFRYTTACECAPAE